MNSMKNFTPRRSFIFTPPLEPKMFDKAVLSGSDIVCLELEDGISPKDKKAARQMAINIISEKQNIKSIEKIIRINSIREKFGLDDIRTILNSNISCAVRPYANAPMTGGGVLYTILLTRWISHSSKGYAQTMCSISPMIATLRSSIFPNLSCKLIISKSACVGCS